MTILPLDGVSVLDFSTLLPGPLASLILSEAGAAVTKLERPGSGEDMRHYPPDWDGHSAIFALLNSGKSAEALDLKSPEALGRLEPMIKGADVLIEQFRPGVMERLGLGYEACRRINPKLIYCSITGYGQNGARAGKAGHDLNYMADAGLAALTAAAQGPAQVPPVLAADIAGGSYPAVINILLALRQRDRTGEGCHLDIAMTDNLFPFAFWAMAGGLAAKDWPSPGQGMLAGGSPRYRLYRAACGGLVAVAALEDKFWAAFTSAIGLEETGGAPEQVIARIDEIIGSRTAEHWQEVLGKADCCCNIVRGLDEAMNDADFQARGLFDYRVEGPSGASLTALPLPLAPRFRAPASEARAFPELKEPDKD